MTGGAAGDRNVVVVKQMLTALGVDPNKDVQLISMSGNSDNFLAAMLAKQLDAGILQVRDVPQLEAAGGTVPYNKILKAPQDGYTVQTSFLTKNKSAVTAYLWAIIRAKQYFKNPDTKDEVIAMCEKHGYKLTSALQDTYVAQLETASPDCGFEVSEMDSFILQSAQLGEFKTNIDWRKAVNLEPLWAAQQAAGLPKRPATL